MAMVFEAQADPGPPRVLLDEFHRVFNLVSASIRLVHANIGARVESSVPVAPALSALPPC